MDMTIDELPLEDVEKIVTLEYLATKVVMMLDRITGGLGEGNVLSIDLSPKPHCPECGKMYSAYFAEWDDVEFESLKEAEDMIEKVLLDVLKRSVSK